MSCLKFTEKSAQFEPIFALFARKLSRYIHIAYASHEPPLSGPIRRMIP